MFFLVQRVKNVKNHIIVRLESLQAQLEVFNARLDALASRLDGIAAQQHAVTARLETVLGLETSGLQGVVHLLESQHQLGQDLTQQHSQVLQQFMAVRQLLDGLSEHSQEQAEGRQSLKVA
jgi:chromosome segregation ATPase